MPSTLRHQQRRLCLGPWTFEGLSLAFLYLHPFLGMGSPEGQGDVPHLYFTSFPPFLTRHWEHGISGKFLGLGSPLLWVHPPQGPGKVRKVKSFNGLNKRHGLNRAQRAHIQKTSVALLTFRFQPQLHSSVVACLRVISISQPPFLLSSN